MSVSAEKTVQAKRLAAIFVPLAAFLLVSLALFLVWNSSCNFKKISSENLSLRTEEILRPRVSRGDPDEVLITGGGGEYSVKWSAFLFEESSADELYEALRNERELKLTAAEDGLVLGVESPERVYTSVSEYDAYQKARSLGHIHIRIHSLKRYLFAPHFVENARKTISKYPQAFRLVRHKNLLF